MLFAPLRFRFIIYFIFCALRDAHSLEQFANSSNSHREAASRNFCPASLVQSRVENKRIRFGAPEWLILVGATVFILVLFVSAWWEADIRWLHFFQAWLYIATILLSLRGNRWGHFIGISTAGFWDYGNIFVTNFFAAGLQQLSTWIHTGHLPHPDLFIAVPAWTSNFLVIAGCLWAYVRRRQNPSAMLADSSSPLCFLRPFSPQPWPSFSRGISPYSLASSIPTFTFSNERPGTRS